MSENKHVNINPEKMKEIMTKFAPLMAGMAHQKTQKKDEFLLILVPVDLTTDRLELTRIEMSILLEDAPFYYYVTRNSSPKWELQSSRSIEKGDSEKILKYFEELKK